MALSQYLTSSAIAKTNQYSISPLSIVFNIKKTHSPQVQRTDHELQNNLSSCPVRDVAQFLLSSMLGNAAYPSPYVLEMKVFRALIHNLSMPVKSSQMKRRSPNVSTHDLRFQ